MWGKKLSDSNIVSLAEYSFLLINWLSLQLRNTPGFGKLLSGRLRDIKPRRVAAKLHDGSKSLFAL